MTTHKEKGVKITMAKTFGRKDPYATAHAAGITTAIIFVICRVLVGVTPGIMWTIGQSWLHGIQLTQSDSWSLSPSSFMLGLVTSSAFAWTVGYLFATLYNKFAGRE